MEKCYKKIISNFENQSTWRWKSNKEATSGYRKTKIKKIIEKTKKEPLTTKDLLYILKNQPNFLGVFSANQIPNIRFTRTFVSFIVNLDNSNERGSHWIGIRVNFSKLEIYDSLGFKKRLWGKNSSHFLNYITKMRKTHKIYTTPVIQSPFTLICGLFALICLVLAQFQSFSDIVKYFRFSRLKNKQLVYLLSNRILK